MEEQKKGGGETSRVLTAFFAAGDRQRVAVELQPGETAIVSWKKLIKDANKANGSTSAPEPPSNANPALESRIAPGQPAETELQDAPPPNRFSAVVEKIERLYMGKQSSDEEDLDDIPDDDQYDTEDSFIDDDELDEYFQVDNSSTKHNGFFVNRGKLERINEPTLLPNQQLKKRRRKDLTKACGVSDDGHVSNEHIKVGKMAAGKSAPLVVKNTSSPSQSLAVKTEHHEDGKFQNQMNASVMGSKKKYADTKTMLDSSLVLKVSNGDASVSLPEAKDIEKQNTGVLQSKNLSKKLKDASVSSDTSHQKYNDRNAHGQSKSQSGRQSNSVDEVELLGWPKEKNGMRELPDTNKAPHMRRKDGSIVRPKVSVLEKAIRELEKMVVESRPPTMELQDADPSSQAVKRRLPREIKQKLAKVARLAASHGKLSKELINRLMSILGHLMQLRTLKRNLKIMINMGLAAKQEKENRFQQIKKEVLEMIKMRVPSKEFEQQAGASDDFQEIGPEEKGVIKRKFSMDDAMEEKICDLYDLYVDGLDEDAGPQIRKLYAEVVHFPLLLFIVNFSLLVLLLGPLFGYFQGVPSIVSTSCVQWLMAVEARQN
ncbi:hypothetical protein L1049_026808 [Liquidambar formosana]|uniref:Hpc2-related domain-containing protein n=1 Tax=Liquidambar formosana TaxID=63359 RepID=A0AAP0NE21_LIQFO